MIRAEHIEENFVNHSKAEQRADRRAHPIRIEKPLVVIRTAERESEHENTDLRQNVREKDRKLLVQFATPQDQRHRRLE